jgi:hypothetical protein
LLQSAPPCLFWGLPRLPKFVGRLLPLRRKWIPAASKPAPKPADPAKGEYKRRHLLPKIVILEPFWWDPWTDVHRPGTSYGEMLDVPAVNKCSKMHEDDLARYYPTEYSARTDDNETTLHGAQW